jgi:polyisoprenoid-binding protein YceI
MSTIEQNQAITGTWTSDPTHSELGFAVKHSGVATIRGQVTDFQAVLEAGDDGLRLDGRGATGSLTTGQADRDVHLASPDFFDAERHPEFRFASTSVRRDGSDLVVDGEITLKGVTRPIELRGEIAGPVVDAFGVARVGVEVEGSLDRTEFGVSWNAPLPGGDLLLSNRVKVSGSFSLVQES